MQRVCFFLVTLSLALSSYPALAVPPHPELQKNVKKGSHPEPGYMKHLRETGPPAVRGKKQVIDELRKKGLFPKGKDGIFQAPGDAPSEGTTAALSQAPPAAGIQRALVLLVSFSDVPAQTAEGFFDTIVFGAARPSMDHYFREVSDGLFGLTTLDLPSTQGWYSLPGTKADYNVDLSLQAMVQDAVAAADPSVDFSPYDNDGDGLVDFLIIVHTGTGGEFTGSNADIWSRTVTLSKEVPTADGVGVDTFMTVPEYWLTPGDMTIGVNVHEFSHLLGLIDLYDLGNDSAGIGAWGLMGHGTWNGPISRGLSPAYLSAYSRLALGWETPEIPAVNLFGETLDPVEYGGATYYLWNDGAANSEYFLLENRQQISYDEYLPHHGLLVWHVDESMSGNSNQVLGHQDCEWPAHFRVALQQADGRLGLEKLENVGDGGDPYPGWDGASEFSLTSVPNSGSYADCLSKSALFNIQESGTSIIADIMPSAPPSFRAEDYSVISPLFPGDEVMLNVAILNAGSVATGIAAQLVSADPAVTVTVAESTYPDLQFREGAENLSSFLVTVASWAAPGVLADLELHVTADGGYAEVLTFPAVLEPAGVLLIDDDQGHPLDSAALLDSLENADRAVGYWDYLQRGTPPLSFLDRFPSLLWTTGPSTTDTVSPEEELLLADYLNGGGSLLLSSQDYYSDPANGNNSLTPFARNYLHATQVFPQNAYPSVIGSAASPLFHDLGPYPLTYPAGFPVRSDWVRPDATAEAIFTESVGRWVAIMHQSPVFRTSYFGFPLEVLDEGDQTETFARFFPWLRPVRGDSTGNGFADVLLVRPDGAGGNDLLVAESMGYALGLPDDRGGLTGDADFLLRGDLNGDGLEDLTTGVIVDADTVQWSAQLAVLIDTPSGLKTFFDAPFLLTGDAGSSASLFFLEDADGDGQADLVYAEPNPSRSSLADWYVALSDGASLSQPPALWAASFGKFSQGTLLVGDISGDGRADLVWGMSNSSVAISTGSAFIKSNSWKDRSGYSKLHFLLGDVNGDGLADLVYSRDGKSGLEWRVSLSAGNAFARAETWTAGFGMGSWESFSLTDLNGDGSRDLMGWRQADGSTVFAAAFSLGLSFDEGRTVGQFTSQPGDRIFP
jgi:immune inhibitor A